MNEQQWLAERFEARGSGLDPSLLTVVESTDLSTVEGRVASALFA